MPLKMVSAKSMLPFFTAAGAFVLFSINVEFEEPVRIFGDYGKIQTLSISPDSKLLAFSSDYRDQKGDIILYNLETKEKKTLTKTDYLESQPVFSKDGKEIYYFINEAGIGSIKKVSVEDGSVSQVTDRRYWCEFPAISPDGRFLVYYSKRENKYNLYEMDLETKKETRLTNEQYFDFGPVYSADGKYIYFYSNRTGSSFSLFKIEKNTQKITPIFGPGGFTFQPTTDMKGQFIFAVSNVSGNNDIYLIFLDNNKTKQVTTSAGNDLFPVIDKKNNRLFFISQREGDYAIYSRSFHIKP
ncbi:MAG: DUF5050 domain-containing protein [Patescibacteria group bacterium]|nr:DUF5050 domain-containing protein [Patescibacteria group bacterium]